jgi:uncharacterized protein YktA (UPF0223 family)
MNDFDRDNLEFFLHGDQKEFEEWMEQASTDDLDYALKLIRIAKAEMLEKHYEFIDVVPHTHDAKQLLKQFTKR